MADYNPIRSVDGRSIPCPSSYLWKLEDTSQSDTGRTEDGVMHKKRIGQVVGLELSWQNISTAKISQILKAFNPEYITVNYLDPMAGGYKTLEFYVGNRSAPIYNSKKGIWSNVSFNIIDRKGANK